MDSPIYTAQGPETIVNEAIDDLGEPGMIIGSMNDGTDVSEAARRHYGQGVRQLLETAWWDFARKKDKLVLLGDATGQSSAPVTDRVEFPWTYAYAWPMDAVLGRWMPWMPANAQPTTSTGIPLTTGVSALTHYPMLPGRFLVSSSDLYPVETGSTLNTQNPDFRRSEGIGPITRKVILTDCCEAHFVYTRLATTIEEWDSLFRQAMVAMMALALAPTVIRDPRLREAKVLDLRKNLKITIDDARVANANDAGFPQSVDHQPIWITGRNSMWPGVMGGNNGTIYPGFSGYTFFPMDASMSWCGSVY